MTITTSQYSELKTTIAETNVHTAMKAFLKAANAHGNLATARTFLSDLASEYTVADLGLADVLPRTVHL